MEAIKDDEVSIQAWVKRGSMLFNTECLEYDDPMHPYNQIVAQGKRPEDYGIRNPVHEEFKRKTRYELIDEILDMRKQLRAYVAAGF